MDNQDSIRALAESVFETHEGGDTIGYMIAAIEADRAARDPHEETEHFLRVAIDRSPEPLRQLGQYLADILDEDQFPRADRLLLGIAEAIGKLTTEHNETLSYCEQQWSDERGFMIDQIQAIKKVRSGYADQAKFADIDCAVHFREFVRRIDAALNVKASK